MTDNEMRIAVAEACGWVWYRIPHSEKHSRGPLRALFLPAVHECDQDPIWLVRADGSERVANMDYMAREGHVPDYLTDLNAMHEAESHLRADQWREYVDELWWIAFGNNEPGDDWSANAAPLIHTTARQRCEAFLRTLGKWKDTPS